VCHCGGGAAHPAVYDINTFTSTLEATIDSVVSAETAPGSGQYNVTVTFSLTKNGAAYDANIAGFAQKTVYVTKYDPATRQFTPSTSLSVLASLGGGQYTAKNNAGAATPVYAAFAPETSDAMVYAYFAENPTLIPVKGNYKLYDNLASVAEPFGTLDYVSAANVAACEKCHGSPYLKHGYRAGAVAGIPDMAACKACHYDTRSGGHQAWQLLVDDPLTYATLPKNASGEPILTTEQKTKYGYVANTMNDTHMSHAMEFAYPQSMGNCVTCHEGKLDMVLSDANFKLATCKSCHPITAVDGADPKRAPALRPILSAAAYNHPMDLYTYLDKPASEGGTGTCVGCHAGKFAQVHKGYNKLIYATDGTKFSSTITTTIDSVAFDAGTNLLTVTFSTNGADAAAVFKPTVVISLYGYDTKDFVVSGHGSTGGSRNLEATFGTDTARLQIAQGATSNAFVATADLTLWAAKLADGSVKKAEIGILPALGLNQTVAPDNSATLTGGAPNPNYNPYIAIAGATKSFDLVGNGGTANAYGKAIVDTAKCNACHDALGTTFHSPTYGSSGVVACRLCHTGLSGGSHLEMQSRSIDSYIHAIHSMQPFDIGDVEFDPTATDFDPVEVLHVEHHIGSTYPNFTTLNCESCHNAGTYEVPDQSLSLPGLLSKSDVVFGRNLTVPAYVTGPGSRACGSCHRAQMINAKDAGDLASFNGHTDTFGYMIDATTNGTGILEAAIQKIMSFF
jgi:OmcA/MtrC family decaheme c-type cytochrome